MCDRCCEGAQSVCMLQLVYAAFLMRALCLEDNLDSVSVCVANPHYV